LTEELLASQEGLYSMDLVISDIMSTDFLSLESLKVQNFVMTWLRDSRLKDCILNPARGNSFLLSKSIQTGPWARLAFHCMCTRDLSLVTSADRLPSSNAEVTNDRSYISASSVRVIE
jgi:hypothetical protein